VLARRATSAAATTRRFWLNLQGAVVLTRKPENVRMGKGKGSKAGVQVRVCPGRVIVAFSAIRSGALRSFYRRLRIRCRFALGLQHVYARPLDTLFEGQELFWRRTRRVQPRYTTAQFQELRSTLRRMRRPALLGYFVRLFW
jgi:hypothetical protein